MRPPSMEAASLSGTVRALMEEARGAWAEREDAGNEDEVLHFLWHELQEVERRLTALSARLRDETFNREGQG